LALAACNDRGVQHSRDVVILRLLSAAQISVGERASAEFFSHPSIAGSNHPPRADFGIEQIQKDCRAVIEPTHEHRTSSAPALHAGWPRSEEPARICWPDRQANTEKRVRLASRQRIFQPPALSRRGCQRPPEYRASRPRPASTMERYLIVWQRHLELAIDRPAAKRDADTTSVFIPAIGARFLRATRASNSPQATTATRHR